MRPSGDLAPFVTEFCPEFAEACHFHERNPEAEEWPEGRPGLTGIQVDYPATAKEISDWIFPAPVEETLGNAPAISDTLDRSPGLAGIFHRFPVER
jgi:hypothetical protein